MTDDQEIRIRLGDHFAIATTADGEEVLTLRHELSDVLLPEYHEIFARFYGENDV